LGSLITAPGTHRAFCFQDNIDVAPAEDLVAQMHAQGIDELIFYDIMASASTRWLSAIFP
jgi:imidazole glycerol phosphate synthase subunit HisF